MYKHIKTVSRAHLFIHVVSCWWRLNGENRHRFHHKSPTLLTIHILNEPRSFRFCSRLNSNTASLCDSVSNASHQRSLFQLQYLRSDCSKISHAVMHFNTSFWHTNIGKGRVYRITLCAIECKTPLVQRPSRRGCYLFRKQRRAAPSQV